VIVTNVSLFIFVVLGISFHAFFRNTGLEAALLVFWVLFSITATVFIAKYSWSKFYEYFKKSIDQDGDALRE